MALDVGRWWKYAQAKLGRAVQDADAELDDLEAEQRARAADRPWLDADDRAPSLDEARARIEWEAEQQRKAAAGAPAPPTAPAARPGQAAGAGRPTAQGDGGRPAGEGPPAAVPTPEAEDPEVTRARLELERQARESKERLAAIREELGIDPPEGPPAAP